MDAPSDAPPQRRQRHGDYFLPKPAFGGATLRDPRFSTHAKGDFPSQGDDAPCLVSAPRLARAVPPAQEVGIKLLLWAAAGPPGDGLEKADAEDVVAAEPCDASINPSPVCY